jgi:hypothetical protein
MPGLSSKDLPRGVVIDGLLMIQDGLPAGSYILTVGIINIRTGLPINLDVDLSTDSGFYEIGVIQVNSP